MTLLCSRVAGCRRDTNATATWRNATDAWANPAENHDCAIGSTRRRTSTARSCAPSWRTRWVICSAASTYAASDLMSPVYTEPLPGCLAAAPDRAPAETEGELDAEDPDVARPAAARAAAPKSTKTAAGKEALRRKTAKPRCVRRFSNGRRSAKRCTPVARQIKRARR